MEQTLKFMKYGSIYLSNAENSTMGLADWLLIKV